MSLNWPPVTSTQILLASELPVSKIGKSDEERSLSMAATKAIVKAGCSGSELVSARRYCAPKTEKNKSELDAI